MTPFIFISILLAVLKYLGAIHVSWWVVFLPIYGPLALFGLIFLAIIAFAIALFSEDN